jgi:hypothetical protein
MFAHTNMVVDPSIFEINPVKKWIDNDLMIPLSYMRHQHLSIHITPLAFSKEE